MDKPVKNGWFRLPNLLGKPAQPPKKEEEKKAETKKGKADNSKGGKSWNDAFASLEEKAFKVDSERIKVQENPRVSESKLRPKETIAQVKDMRDRVRDEYINFGDPKQDCKRVISIPQENGSKTCWFNALLMVFFYSQNMRAMMIERSKLWVVKDPNKDKSSRARAELYSIFTDILFSMYDYDTETKREKIYFKFQQISPEKILFKLNEVDPVEFPINPKEGAGYNAVNYIQAICTILHIKVVFLISEPDGKTGKDLMYLKNFVNREWLLVSEIVDANKAALDGADIVLVDNLKSYSEQFRETVFDTSSKLANGHQDIKQYRADLRTKHVRIGETEYIKDAVFLTSISENDDAKCANHEIAGITCNNQGYIYNGWILKRTNKDVHEIGADGRAHMGRPSLPCELLRYEWQDHKDVQFSLNKDRCEIKVDRGGLRDLNFNLVNGTRNLVYVNKKYIKNARHYNAKSRYANENAYMNAKGESYTTPSTRRISRDGGADTMTLKTGYEKADVQNNTHNAHNAHNAHNTMKARKNILKKYKFSPVALQCIRQVANMSKLEPSYKFDSSAFNPSTLLKDLPIVSPKMELLLQNIEALDAEDVKRTNQKFKHVIFSDVKQGFGAKVITSALIATGMEMVYNSSLKMKDPARKSGKEGIALLTGSSLYGGKTFTKRLRDNILETFNKRPDNVYGKDIRFIILDSSFREGIDLYDVRYMHIFEPQISTSEEKQVIGRGTRYCGQAGLKFDTSNGWPLYVKVYDSLLPEDLWIKEDNIKTLHDLYMEKSGVDTKKYVFAREISKMIIMGAVDYKLNKTYHTFRPIDDNLGGEKSFPPDGMTLFKNYQQNGGGKNENKNKEKENKKEQLISCKEACENPRLTTDIFLVYLSGSETKTAEELFTRVLEDKNNNKIDKNILMRVLCKELEKNALFCRMVQRYFQDKHDYIFTFRKRIRTNLNMYAPLLSKRAGSILSDLKALFMKFTKSTSSSSSSSSSDSSSIVSSRDQNTATKTTKTSKTTKTAKTAKATKAIKGSSTLSLTEDAPSEDDRLKILKRDFENKKRLDLARYDEFELKTPLSKYQASESERFIAFRKYVAENFMQYAWVDLEFKNMCGVKKDKKFPPKVQALIDMDPVFRDRMTYPKIANFNPTQEFIRHYFSPSIDLKGIILNHSTGTGKCHAFDTPILMSDGNIKMVQDVEEGDLLMGDDFTPRLVYSLARGSDEMFEVHQQDSDAISYGVNQEHILCLLCQDERTRQDLSEIGIDPKGDGVYELEVRHFLSIRQCLQENLFGYKVIKDQNEDENENENRKCKNIVTPISLKHCGQGDYYGFTIGGNGRYLLGDNTVTHNTCTAIATATSAFEKEGYKIIWVTRKDLKEDMYKNIFGSVICHAQIQQKIKDGILKSIPPESDTRSRNKLLGEAWPFVPISYLQFSNLLSKGNEFSRKMIELNGARDPLKKTLIVIDEAHKLYGETKDLTGERHNMAAMERGIMNSYNVSGRDSVRLLLMTATPFTNEPMDMVKLLNLCKTEKEAMPTDTATFAREYLDDDGTFSKSGSIKFLNGIAGHISYLNSEFDAREYAQPIIEHIHANMSTSTAIAMKNKIKKSLGYLLSDKEVWVSKLAENKDDVIQAKRAMNRASEYEKDALREDLRDAEKKFEYVKDELAKVNGRIKQATTMLKPNGKGGAVDQDKSQENFLFERCMKKGR